jgi:ADP-heptose:LPS heptosyltransferase
VAARLADQFTSFDAPRVASLFRRSDPDPSLGSVDLAIAWLGDPEGAVARNLVRLGAQRVIVAPSRPAGPRPVHAADYLVSTLARLGVVPGGQQVSWLLDLPPNATELAEAAMGHPVGILHPGSGSPAKNWPYAKFADLASRLPSEIGLPAAIVVGPAESESLAPIGGRLLAAPPIISNLPLMTVAALISRASFYVGNDSGPTHLAAAVGCPTVALFGPSDPAVWAPRGPRVRVIRHEPLAELPVRSVLTAVRELIESPTPRGTELTE